MSTPYRRIIAIDPSLTCSGWALFDIPSGTILGVGKIKSLKPQIALASRFLDLQGRIGDLFTQLSFCSTDILVCEAPTTMKDPKAALKVEHVRSIFETLARELGAYVPGRLNPRSVHNEVIGLTGAQLARPIIKEMAAKTVRTLHGSDLKRLGFLVDDDHLRKHQDIIDAILLGNLALSRIRGAKNSGVAIESLFQSAPSGKRGGWAW